MSNKLSVYLAGPDVFNLDAVARGHRYVKLAAARGLIGKYPLDNEVDLSRPDASLVIYQLNKQMLESCDVIVANLNDFRGFEPDSGTVWELAYGIGIGKKVIAYTSSPDTIVKRVAARDGYTIKQGAVVDKDDLIVENFGHPFNLMIQHSVDAVVIGDIEQALDEVVKRFGTTKP